MKKNYYIHPFTDPYLTRRSIKIHQIIPETITLIREMELIRDTLSGVGLAANQIGEFYRIAIINYSPIHLALVNPEIIDVSEDQDIAYEGCLSYPDVVGQVRRYSTITVKAIYIDLQNPHWSTDYPRRKTENRTFTDFTARAIQHEIDHLNGITYLNRMPLGEPLKSTTPLNGVKGETSNDPTTQPILNYSTS